jgi:hypothetical protein
VLASLPFRVLCGGLGLFLLGVAIYAGFEGTSAPDRNIALTLLFVTSWLGFPLFSVILGNVFAAFNPWNAIAAPVGAGYRKLAGRAPRHFEYPEKLGRWPAAVGLAAFVWLELIHGTGGGVAVGVEPEAVARAASYYTAYTLIMVAAFGREKWFANGEIFSVYFGMFGSLGKFEFRDGTLGVRRFLAGSTRWVAGAGSVAVIITSIGTTTFDGAQEGVFKGGVDQAISWLGDLGLGATASVRLGSTIFMAISIAIVALVYLIGIRGMSTVPVGPARHRYDRPLRHGCLRHQLRRDQQRDRLVRPGRHTRRRSRRRPPARSRPRHRRLVRLPPGRPLPVLDARRDGRLHLLRPLPALGLQRLTRSGSVS